MNSKALAKKVSKALTRKIIEQANRELLDLEFDTMDQSMATGWHKATGLKVEEWMKYLFKYGKERNRKLFFALSPYGKPTAYFDANSEKEWNEVMNMKANEKIRFLEEKGFKRDKKKNTNTFTRKVN